MKRKSPFVYSDTILKIHAVTFTVFIIGIWYGVIATLTYEGNNSVPFGTYKAFLMNRVGLTLFWGLLFLAHIAAHQFRAVWMSQGQRRHMKEVRAIQERYVSTARLDLEAQPDKSMTEADRQRYALLDMDYSRQEKS